MIIKYEKPFFSEQLFIFKDKEWTFALCLFTST